ncbi:sigma-70 family RNA polymerase sigma factor [Streptomyces cylindrosporus]|uniref:Sigma-70 family RNA polymerase sigma factor n=1 Tax=Streptomyces cylindrosporus TaxID=2927583 RepID=A0ABS9YQZ0_9ACTN|nr:sigma-70 family RNA polymerase sigma factor [Streptomyces cylindrosporus]MCI3279131.1 sigma-70 family RNA polymerase sigma factor [Streptomyces cylindrosporus]
MNEPPELPEVFKPLASLFEGPETIEQAALLSVALRAIPDLQKALRKRREHVVVTLNERDGISYTDMAPHLKVKPERVSGIARGHSRTPRPRKRATAEGEQND